MLCSCSCFMSQLALLMTENWWSSWPAGLALSAQLGILQVGVLDVGLCSRSTADLQVGISRIKVTLLSHAWMDLWVVQPSLRAKQPASSFHHILWITPSPGLSLIAPQQHLQKVIHARATPKYWRAELWLRMRRGNTGDLPGRGMSNREARRKKAFQSKQGVTHSAHMNKSCIGDGKWCVPFRAKNSIETSAASFSGAPRAHMAWWEASVSDAAGWRWMEDTLPLLVFKNKDDRAG